ncbi:hypothetical protein ACFV0L_10365 [Streptosporangium canum]|uniref:hypothetical protein n=1 Tax=Streptosporangium canum TaxID=324952 RepID=UPI0036A1C7BC
MFIFLVPIERFEAATGSTLDTQERAKALVILEDVSALVTSFCGRDFQWHENATVTLYPSTLARSVYWPHELKPVTSVQAVTFNGQPYASYKVRPEGLVLTADYVPSLQVTLTYGYQSVPGDVRAVALTESLYRFNSEPGVSQEQVGDLITDYMMFQPTLSRESRRVLRRYRPPIRSVGL